MQPTTARLRAIDFVRGVVMVLMAIDHVRVYAGQPPGGPTAGIFFTRWVTHFAAPAFCFLAGTSALLHGRKLGSPRALARYLATRGLMLVVLELTLIRFAWTFNLDYAHYIQANVIWVLGWSMISLAAIVRLPAPAIGIAGLVIIFAQQLLRLLPASPWLQLLYTGGKVPLGGTGLSLSVIYALVPWVGVMMAGYGFGPLMLRDTERRDRVCVWIGGGATAVFLIVATAVALAQPSHVSLLFRVLGQQKYPASQLYLLMTLGPTIALLPFAERARGWVADVFATFGRVPLFYYLLHIPLIHTLAIGVSLARRGRVEAWLFGNHPWAPPAQPAGYMWDLGLLYVVFALAVPLLYVACLWYAGRKVRYV